MKIEFSRPGEEEGAPETVIGEAEWVEGRAVVSGTADDAARATIAAFFRETPVVVDDGALRTLSGRGPSLVQPGSLEWFRVAAQVRGKAEGLSVRFISEIERGDGWDPAAQYRAFREAAGS